MTIKKKSVNLWQNKVKITMKRILSFGYGRIEEYDKVKSSGLSSRHFYGMVELQRKYEIHQISLYSRAGVKGFLINNFRTLKSCDIVFMAYLYVTPLLFLSILKHLGLCHRQIVVVSHHTLEHSANYIHNRIYKYIYSSIDIILFHSPKNLSESVDMGLVKKENTDTICWGEDLEFVNSTFRISDKGYFISTGRENRDFPLLIEAFAHSEASLELYTNKYNYDNDYSFLDNVIDTYPNIKIEFVEKDHNTMRILGQKTAESRCVVIPLIKNTVNYCVGLTSIVEAMALGKPIISSPNPYSPINLEEEGIGFYADTLEEWRKAIDFLNKNPEQAQKMGKKARDLAKKEYNIVKFSKMLDKLFS